MVVASLLHLTAFIGFLAGASYCQAGNCSQRRRLACYVAILLQGLTLAMASKDMASIHVGTAFGYYTLLAICVLAVVDHLANFTASWRMLSALAALGCLFAAIPLRGHAVDASVSGFALHLVLGALAYGFFLVSLAQLLEVYWLNHTITRHKTDAVNNNLSLLQMEKQVFRNIGVGFVILTLTIISGAVVAFIAATAIGFSHKILFAGLTWLCCAVLLTCRWRFGWRGLVALRWFAAATMSLVLSYLGTVIVLDLILSK